MRNYVLLLSLIYGCSNHMQTHYCNKTVYSDSVETMFYIPQSFQLRERDTMFDNGSFISMQKYRQVNDTSVQIEVRYTYNNTIGDHHVNYNELVDNLNNEMKYTTDDSGGYASLKTINNQKVIIGFKTISKIKYRADIFKTYPHNKLFQIVINTYGYSDSNSAYSDQLRDSIFNSVTVK